MRSLALAVAVTACCAPAFALAQPVDGQKRIGFVVEPHLGTTLFSFATGAGGGVSALATLQGGFLLGAKINRVIFGIGFDLERVATGNTPQAGPTSTTAT